MQSDIYISISSLGNLNPPSIQDLYIQKGICALCLIRLLISPSKQLSFAVHFAETICVI